MKCSLSLSVFPPVWLYRSASTVFHPPPPHALLHLTIRTCRAGVELLQDNTDTRFSREADFCFSVEPSAPSPGINAGILSPVPLKGSRSHGRVEGAEPVSSLDPTFHLCCFLLLSLWSGLYSLTTTPPPPLPPAKFNSFKRAGASEENLSPVLLPPSTTCLDHRWQSGGRRSETTVEAERSALERRVCFLQKCRTQRKRGRRG